MQAAPQTVRQTRLVANPFFSAWHWENKAGSYPVYQQPYDGGYVGFTPDLPRQSVPSFTGDPAIVEARDWAKTHPGKIFIVGDEVEGKSGWDNNPDLYARDYCDFITGVRDPTLGDPTARFAPAGYVRVDLTWLNDFINAYRAGSCGTTPIAEWTFHVWPNFNDGLAPFQSFVSERAAWAATHGAVQQDSAPMVLGSWNVGGPEQQDDDSLYAERVKAAMTWLQSQPRVIHARWLNYNSNGDTHPLTNSSGYLTREGLAYTGFTRPSIDVRPFFLSSGQSVFLGEDNVHGGVQLGSVYWQNDVWIDGVQYTHAIGMHAASSGAGRADFWVPLGATTFTSIFGYARQDGNSCSGENDVGRVYVDGALLWTATISGSSLSTATSTGSISLPSGARILRLEVDAQGNNYCAHTTWGDPQFTKGGGGF